MYMCLYMCTYVCHVHVAPRERRVRVCWGRLPGARAPTCTSPLSSATPARPSECARSMPEGEGVCEWAAARCVRRCVEETTRMPISTMKDHFRPIADAGSPDRTAHLKKTEFSEYTEVKVRVMNQLGKTYGA
jgi:hypothetical protein